MERVLCLEDIRNCSSSPIHCVAQTGNLYNCKRISLRSGMKKWSGLSWEWPSALQDSRLRGLMRTFIAKQFLSFLSLFFFLHPWFLSFKVNDLSTTITTTKKPWFSCVFPGEWKQTQGGEGGKEWLVLLNFSLRVTLAPRVRLALSSVSLENRHLFCSLRHLSWKVSMVTAVLVLPCHAIR